MLGLPSLHGVRGSSLLLGRLRWWYGGFASRPAKGLQGAFRLRCPAREGQASSSSCRPRRYLGLQSWLLVLQRSLGEVLAPFNAFTYHCSSLGDRFVRYVLSYFHPRGRCEAAGPRPSMRMRIIIIILIIIIAVQP